VGERRDYKSHPYTSGIIETMSIDLHAAAGVGAQFTSPFRKFVQIAMDNLLTNRHG
jgi:hypothetical protein